MITSALFALIMWMLDVAFWQWWLDPLLALLQRLEVMYGFVNSSFGIIINSVRILTYFVPITHQIAIIGIVVSIVLVKAIFAIYNQVAQIIP